MVSVEIVDDLIASSRPRGRLLQGSTLILLGLSMLLGAMAANPSLLPGAGPLTWLLPQVVLLTILALIVRSARHQRRLARYLQEGVEAVQLREWGRAREALERLLSHPIRYPTARAESLLALAAVAEAGRCYDASQRIYESLLEDRQADPVQLYTARLALAGAMLRTGQVTDAISLIDRIDREELPDVLRAHVELLSLFREITMGQADSGLDRAERRRELFRRHLGTKAGYGLALLAAAFDRAGQEDAARRHWHDATLLVPAADLVHRFDDLAPLASKYPATARPAEIRPALASGEGAP